MSDREILLNELFRKIAAMSDLDVPGLEYVCEKMTVLRNDASFPEELIPACGAIINIARAMITGGIDYESGYESMCDTMDGLSRQYKEHKMMASQKEAGRQRPKLIPDEQDMEEIGVTIEILGGVLEELTEEREHLLDAIENFCDRLFDNVPEGGDLWKKAEKISKLLHLYQTGRRTFLEFKSSMWEVYECMKKAFTAIESGLEEHEQEVVALDEPEIPLHEEVVESRVQEPEPAVVKKPVVADISVPEFHLDTSNPELNDFVAETNEYLDGIENALMELEKDPSNQEMLNEAFRFIHNVKGISGFLDVRDANKLAHVAESLLDEARQGTVAFAGPVSQACFMAVDVLREMTLRIERAIGGAEYMTPVKYKEVMAALMDPDTLKEVPAKKEESEIDEIRRREAGAESQSVIIPLDDDPAEMQEPSVVGVSESGNGSEEKNKFKNGEKNNCNKYDAMVKVSTTRLDSLIDAVGELVISNAMIMRVTQEREDLASELAQNVAQLDNITRDLQELAMGMRMVSLKPVFQRMARVARDLSINSGVPVDFTFSGEDTEIDRNVVEEISSPLVHMVRNAVDHGIDSPEDRRKHGKPENGQVHLKAYHEGGNVVIEVTDDGRGLDREKIMSKARRMGLVTADADLSQRECFNLIFHPGFSTAAMVTDVSGRGVGMDVVKKSIESLRGRVEIQSLNNHGTTFIIRLPLTLAIIDGMMVKCGAEYYIIPTISIQESLRPTDEDLSTAANRGEMVAIRGSLAPMFRLNQLMNIPDAKDDPRDALLLIMGENGDRFALMVDDLLGQQQVVIKSLGKIVGRPPGISGGAIMGDGKVALILDTPGLKRLANDYEKVLA